MEPSGLAVRKMMGRERNAARAVDGRDALEAETDGLAGDLAAPEAGGTEIEIRLTDLIGDENGETVLYNDSDARIFRIVADGGVLAEGRTERHVTAGGADVSGFRYLRFSNGLTIFFAEGLSVVVHGAEDAPGS